MRERGIAELPGKADNPRIVEYLKSTTLESVPQFLHDETPWCSSFVNWCFEAVGMRGTNKANARSWLEWGLPMILPQPGCVAVFSSARGPTAGHVAFYMSQTQLQIHVFGGNQYNRVGLAPQPRPRLLGYRWPSS